MRNERVAEALHRDQRGTLILAELDERSLMLSPRLHIDLAEPFDDHRPQVGERPQHRLDVRPDARRPGPRHATVGARRNQRVEHTYERAALVGGERGLTHQSNRFARFCFIVSAT